MLASSPASILNQSLPDLGIPYRFNPNESDSKYAQIATSMHELGIIEPPVVARDQTHPGKYLLLDGHSRIEVLKDKGQTEVTRLISTDDEAFTYNKRVNRLAMIQEHRMPQGGRARRSRGSYCQSAERRRCEHCPEAKTARGDLPRSC
jgi:hypothetical protein